MPKKTDDRGIFQARVMPDIREKFDDFVRAWKKRRHCHKSGLTAAALMAFMELPQEEQRAWIEKALERDPEGDYESANQAVEEAATQANRGGPEEKGRKT